MPSLKQIQKRLREGDYVADYIGGSDYRAEQDIMYLLEIVKQQSKELKVAKAVIKRLVKNNEENKSL